MECDKFHQNRIDRRNLLEKLRIARFLRRHNLIKPVLTQQPKVMYRHVISVDIIGLSKPDLTQEEQTRKIEVLNKCLMECEVFRNSQKEIRLSKSTGDGFLIGVSENITFPIELGIQLHEKLEEYNQLPDVTHPIKIRMGIHSGTASPVEFIMKDEWGEAYIGATRIMNIGGADHILLSSKIALDLIHLSTKYEQILHYIGEYRVKHNVVYSVYSAFDNNFGNFYSPPKIDQKLLSTFESPEIPEFSKANSLNPIEFKEFLWGLVHLDSFTSDTENPPMTSHYFVNLFRLMHECNLRVSEAINLRKGDFDLRHKIIMIRYPNSDKVQKNVTLPEDGTWLQKFLLRFNDEDRIFPTTSEIVYQYAVDACRLAGLDS